MTKSLRVIALISGGKDSLYTLLHCVQNGHTIVALANLHPMPQDGVDSDATEEEEIDSFMYQTVGHNVIPLYADALQIPLYRQQIKGTPQQTGRYYDSSLGQCSPDETEDLIPLLENVAKHHPEADAVCSGAILSTYQRTRIESVALRLGLVPLAYLWQYPFLPPPPSRPDSLTGLLEDMSAAGCDSRIIKLASGGLPEDLLGSSVANTKTMALMVASMAPYAEHDEAALRGAVLGEGGEFETLAVNGPCSVWKRKIEIKEKESLVIVEEGGVEWLKLRQTKVVEQEREAEDKTSIDLVRVPSTLDPQIECIAAMGMHVQDKVEIAFQGTRNVPRSTTLMHQKGTSVKLSLGSHTLSVANMTAPNLPGDASQQVEHIVTDLKRMLFDISEANNINPSLSSASIISTTILLASMSSFPSINASYAQLCSPGVPNPPARVTIACSLPPKTLVSLSCVISLLPRSTHHGLHVQSRSYWAPANIGPYSQAICVPFQANNDHSFRFVHVAGQIPLVSASMEMLVGSFTDQALLALQHLWRVGQERGVDLWTWGVAFLPRLDEADAKQQPQILAEIWKHAHLTTIQGKSASTAGDEDDTEETGVDAWDLKHNQSGIARLIPTVGQHRHILPNTTAMTAASVSARPWIPPLIIAEVDELPRSAPVEWHAHGLARLPKRPSSTAAVSAISHAFPWGQASICTVSYNSSSSAAQSDSDSESADGDDRLHEQQRVHFVTVQAFRAAAAAYTSRTDVPAIAELLQSILPPPSSSTVRAGVDGTVDHQEHRQDRSAEIEKRNRLGCVHGVAYIVGEQGEAALAALGQLEAMPGVAVIPCRRLAGECDQTVAGVDVTAVGGLAELSLAVTLRIDDVID